MKDLDSGQRNGLPERGVKVNNHDSEPVCFSRKCSLFPMEECIVLPGNRKCLLKSLFAIVLSNL